MESFQLYAFLTENTGMRWKLQVNINIRPRQVEVLYLQTPGPTEVLP